MTLQKESPQEIDSDYTDEQLDIEFPERIMRCKYCKKKFVTRFDCRYCSENCANKFLFYHNKSDRNLVGKDARRLKGTGRRKNW